MATQGLHQYQKQTQTLVLAPQLRQSLKILQVSALDLRTAILEELQSNPALEELPMDGISIEENNAPDEESDRDKASTELELGEDYAILNQLDEDWREYYAQDSGNTEYTTADADRRQHFFDSIVNETSLQEHLMSQAMLSEASEGTITAFEYLIGSLDDRGYVITDLADLALASGLPFTDMDTAGKLLKSLDPPGIGSRNLQECLLTQLTLLGRGNSTAATIIKDHFDRLLRRRIPKIGRKIGLPVTEVQSALEEIATLNPAPGRRFADDVNQVVIPDVKVEWDGTEWLVTLNNDYIPRLRLSSIYKNLIAKGKLSRRERDYIREKIRSGKFLISSIEQRQQTIERISRELLKFQEDFFKHGVSRLHPLTMNRVAEAVGVHETTVSRAIANKYIETPHGVFEFKYFFTTGYRSGVGEFISNTSIKDTIAKLIEAEDPAKPFSDQEVVNILSKQNIKIARRTIAKYREALGIPPTNLRRRYE
jgi:RNA polymerase sigma-54 factor